MSARRQTLARSSSYIVRNSSRNALVSASENFVGWGGTRCPITAMLLASLASSKGSCASNRTGATSSSTIRRRRRSIFLEHWEGAIAEPTFFDGALRRFLINEGHAEHIGASYAYPAFGGFKDHRSSNTPNTTRVCHWNNLDRQSGTFARSAHEKDVKRSIGKFVKKGPVAGGVCSHS